MKGTKPPAYAKTMAVLAELAAASIRWLTRVLTQHDPARDADAEDVEPALREIGQVGIK